MGQGAHLTLVDEPGDVPDEWERSIASAERAMRKLVRLVVVTRTTSPDREMELHCRHADRLSMLKRYGQAVGW